MPRTSTATDWKRPTAAPSSPPRSTYNEPARLCPMGRRRRFRHTSRRRPQIKIGQNPLRPEDETFRHLRNPDLSRLPRPHGTAENRHYGSRALRRGYPGPWTGGSLDPIPERHQGAWTMSKRAVTYVVYRHGSNA